VLIRWPIIKLLTNDLVDVMELQQQQQACETSRMRVKQLHKQADVQQAAVNRHT
jgi:hypothetical protein